MNNPELFPTHLTPRVLDSLPTGKEPFIGGKGRMT